MAAGFEKQPIRFAYSHGARLAYQVFGEGVPNMVAIPPMAQHIERAWEWPDVESMLEQFGFFTRYLHFDKRSTGASDRRSRVPGLDERVEDLRAVMDDAGFETAHLFACSEGGPMAILFAATYPDRVDGLILHGSFAAQHLRDEAGNLVEPEPEAMVAYAHRWGTSESQVAEGFAPSLASDPRFVEWHRSYERSAADTDSLLELLELTYEADVRDLLPTLEVPTLVLHRKGDRAVPVWLGKELADGIPDARFVELEGDDHFQYAGDVRTWMDEVERFVTGSVTPRVPTRAAPLVSVRTLGQFKVLRDGEEVPVAEWGSRLARQVLKRLIVARGWPVTRDELIDICWPDETDMRRLGARLSVQLSGIRRVLGGGVIADRSSVRLDLELLDIDLERFFAAAADSEIVDAYSGEFLPEDRYEDWADPMRNEARTRFVTAARRLAGGEIDPDRRIVLAQRLIAVDRYDEQAHRLLVSALLEAGETREAQRAHAAWASALAELDVEVPRFEDFL